MKNIKKAAAVFIAAALILLILPSCAVRFNHPKEPPDTEPVTDSSSPAEDEPDEKDYVKVENKFAKEVSKHLNKIGNADYGGAVVMVATPREALIDEDSCGAVMSKTVSERNSLVEKKFNISLYAKSVDPDTMYTELSNACRAGDYYADILMIPQYYISQFAVSGLLFNLNSLPFADFNAGFNIESGTCAAMASNDGYAVAGWGSFEPDFLSAVFFNKDVIEEAGLESPYKLVREGRWTWDKFFEYTSYTETVNAARGKEGLPALYSYGAQNAYLDLSDLVYVSEGGRFISGGLGNPSELSISYDGSYHAMENAKRLYADTLKEQNPLEAINTFAEGGSVFLIDRLSTAKTIASSSAKWGIVPLPKGDEAQEKHVTLMSNESLFFAVPVNCNNAETVSRTLSGLNAASLGYMVDAYVTDAMYYYLRDNDSVDMMEKICYSAYYDMAYTFGSYDPAVSNSTYFAVRNVGEGISDMNYYLSRNGNGANRALRRLFP